MIVPAFVLATTTPERLDLGGAWHVVQPERKIDVVGKVPGSVHTDLLAAKAIPDPFYRDQEKDVQWVGEVPWTYSRRFVVPAAYLKHRHVVLRSEGLDTLATIRLNGKEVAKTGNQFRTWEFDVAPFLKAGDNAIDITFDPVGPVLKAKENQAAFPGKPAWGQGYVRKSPVQNGWDFAPKLLTAGIPRPIGLVAWDEARLDDVLVTQDHRKSEVDLKVAVSARAEGTVVAESTASYGGKVVATTHGPLGRPLVLAIKNPQLWWPAGMGGQPLYRLRTVLKDAQGRVLDEKTERIGLRTVVWTPKTDAHPLSVAVNGRPFFVKGANWIPPDALNARVKADDYRRLVALAKRGNMNMLRFWGGGLYEDDALYDACDEAGLLVWFEFKFACTPYPAFDPAWVEDVRCEAVDNVTRLRNHPSIAIWSGNNEVAGFVDEKTSMFRMSREDYDGLFHKTLANVVTDLVPGAQYTPGSPESGDEHNWNVWHGGAPFETYRKDRGFMSEFGFQSFPEPRTMAAVTAPEDRTSVLSPVMKYRQRNIGGHGNENIANTVERYFRKPKDFDSALWTSQINQAMGILTGIEAWRRDWPNTTGSLVWQFDDDWPTPSWSMIDYYLRPKALYYRLAGAYAPTMLSGLADGRTGVVELTVANDVPKALSGTLDWRLLKTDGSVVAIGHKPVAIPAGTSARKVASVDLSKSLMSEGRQSLVFAATLVVNGKEASRTTLLFGKPKDVALQDPGIKVERSGDRVTLTATKPALYAWVDAGEGATYSDNFLDLRPGEPRTIVVHGGAGPIRVRSLFDTYDPSAPLPDPTFRPEADGTIRATAERADTLGGQALEAGNPPSLGNWADVDDAAEWRVEGAKPGLYRVIVTLASPEGGSRFTVSAGDGKVSGVVPKTGSWTAYTTLDLGTVRVAQGGSLRIALTAQEKKGSHVMNLRSVVLTPM